MPESELKPGKKKVAKRPLKSNRIAKKVSKTTRGKKRNQKKKAVKNIKTKSKKSLKIVPLEKTALIVEKDAARPPNNIISNNIPNPIDNIIENGGSGKNQNAIITTDRFFHDTPKTNFFIILSILSIIIFLAAGYVYPATEDDIVKGKVIWNYDGKFDRGLFSQLYASMAFTLGVFLLGYYVYATFIKFNVKKWNFFAWGSF